MASHGTPSDPQFSATWFEGGRKRRRRGFTKRTDAEAFLARVRVELDDGSRETVDPMVVDGVTVGHAIEAYGRHLAEKGLKPGPNAERLRRLRCFFPDTGALLSELTPAKCIGLYEALRARPGKHGKAISVDTHRNILAARYQGSTMRIQISRLRSCFTWAVDSGRIAANPIARIKLPRTKPKRETEISAEGEVALLKRFDERMKAFFLVAIDSGMRRDEIRLLEWSDFDAKARTLTIPAARAKSRKARVGRLTTRALEALLALPKMEGSPFIFASSATRRPFSKSWVGEAWRRAADGAGLKAAPGDGSVHLHDARGTAATRMLRLGATLPAVQKVLGHADMQTTQRYLRVNSRDVDAAHALLEKAVGT